VGAALPSRAGDDVHRDPLERIAAGVERRRELGDGGHDRDNPADIRDVPGSCYRETARGRSSGYVAVMPKTFRQRARRTLLIGVLAPLALSACSDEDRPTDGEWEQLWLGERDEFPSAETFLAGGQEFCDRLLGELRVDLPALLPTPAEGLDDAVDSWVKHAESIAFDCPSDRDELDDRLETLTILAAEVDAGLAADEQR
jgi:hypothetical protein